MAFRFASFCCIIARNKPNFESVDHSACVVYTKTINHLGVGEIGGYLPRHGFTAR